MFGVSAVTALAVTAAVGTAYSIYAGERAAGAQKDAANQARQAAGVQANLADQANNAANKKRPNLGAMMQGNQAAAMGGGASTMLTGPAGVDTTSLSLGKNTLLGS
jgi:hypothetical protein